MSPILNLPIRVVVSVFVIKVIQKIKLIDVLVLIKSKNNISTYKHNHLGIIFGDQNFWYYRLTILRSF